MALMSSYLENKILDAVCKNTSLAVTTVYISLHTASPSTTGANEVAGGSYVRQSGSFAAASGGTNATNGTLTFASMPSCTVTHVGFWDASTNGNFLWGGALAS